MKKAVIVGGSNGAGLAITKALIDRGFYAVVLDRVAPQQGVLDGAEFSYRHIDLLDLNYDALEELASDPEVSFLMITAGFGRVADFEYFHPIEISNMITVNATATICILKTFYSRIKSSEDFYCGVMGSISGWMSSPMAAVYAASKAAICRFMESVNVEIEYSGSSNRITDISPASFKGSRFNGGENNIDLLADLARDIVSHIFARDCLYIPQYEELLKGVLERYHSDPHGYGLYSYEYKRNSGRIENTTRMKIAYVHIPGRTVDRELINKLAIMKRKCSYLCVGIGASEVGGEDRDAALSDMRDALKDYRFIDRIVCNPGSCDQEMKKLGCNCFFVFDDAVDADSIELRFPE